MKKIVDAPKSRAKNAQHVQFMSSVLARIPQETAAKYGFTTQWTAFSTAEGDESYCFQPEKGYMTTPDIVLADDFRDKVFYFYKQLAKVYADYCPDAEKQKAGRNLYFVFNGNPRTAKEDLTSETAILTDLVEKLRVDPYLSALSQLGIESAPDEIEAANQAFIEEYDKRSTQVRERSFAFNMRTLRPITDAAYDELTQTINILYAANELVAKDETTRTELGKLIDDVNDVVVNFRRIIGSGSSGSSENEPTPEPTPVTPEITAVYQKEGGDPENPHRIERGKQTGMKYQGFTLKGQDGTLEHVIGLVNDQDYIEWINPETISNVTETSCEFTMVPDLTEGQYKVRIETYDGGSPLVIEYPEMITLW